MKVTVIVTVYNRLEYTRNILLCLLNQTKNIEELIFVDDGSKENLKDYIADLLPKCNFKIKHIYQADLGFRLSRSRNNGVRHAEGDYLIFLDQDVVFPNDFIENICKNGKKKVMTYTKPIASDENEKNEIQKLLCCDFNYNEIYKNIKKEVHKVREKSMKKDLFYSFLHSCHLRSRGGKIAGLMFALYKEDYININGFDEKYKAYGYEDDDFGNRFFKYGGKTRPVTFLEYPVHMYHYFDSTKKHDLNKNYYQQRKKEIFLKNDFFCEFGFKNSIDKDEVKVNILK